MRGYGGDLGAEVTHPDPGKLVSCEISSVAKSQKPVREYSKSHA